MPLTLPWPKHEIPEIRRYGPFLFNVWRKQVWNGHQRVRLTTTDAVIFRTIAEAGKEGVTRADIRREHEEYFGKPWQDDAKKADRVRISNLRRTLKPLHNGHGSVIRVEPGRTSNETRFYLQI